MSTCRELEAGQATTNSCVGTACIMSPEMINGQPYTTKTDMWSLGITAVFIATLQDAINARTFDTLTPKIRRGQATSHTTVITITLAVVVFDNVGVRAITGQYSPDIDQLVHSLVQTKPDRRPSASLFISRLHQCSEHCSTPPTATSYPGRQMVPQTTSSSSSMPSKTPTPRHPLVSADDVGGTSRRSSCKKIPRSAVGDKYLTASQTTSSLLLRRDKRFGDPISSDAVVSGQPGTHNAAPAFDDLSLSLPDMELDRTDNQASTELTDQGRRDLRRQQVPCQRGRDLDSPPHEDSQAAKQVPSLSTITASAMKQEHVLARIADVIEKSGRRKSKDDDKMPKRSGMLNSQCLDTLRTLTRLDASLDHDARLAFNQTLMWRQPRPGDDPA
ncbi:hypothetical protein ACOMHN_020861 [Nucella lapillus]